MSLQRHYNQLREEIAKIKPPEGLEDEEEGESIDPQGVHFSTDSALSSAMNSSQLAAIENLITDSNSNSVLEDGFCWHIEKLDNFRENPDYSGLLDSASVTGRGPEGRVYNWKLVIIQNVQAVLSALLGAVCSCDKLKLWYL